MPEDIPRRHSLPRRRAVRSIAAALVSAGLLATALAVSAFPARAARAVPATPTAVTAPTEFELDRSLQSVPIDGQVRLAVRSTLTTDTPYLEVRFQVLRPAGGVMLQKTEIRHDLAPGDVDIRFERETASLGLRPAAYPVLVRVRRSDSEGRTHEQTIDATLFLYDPATPPAPVAVVVRLTGAPRLDTEGRFVEDPAVFTTERDLAMSVARELTSSGGRVSLALTPLMLDEWRRASGGYAVTGPEGVRQVPAGSAPSAAYASTLTSLANLAALDRVELLDVPYADPDLVGLETADGTPDLERHYDLGLSTYLASLEQTPSVGTAVFEDRLTPEALPALAARGIAYAAVSPASLSGKDASSASGAYRSGESTATLLVLDENLGKDLLGDRAAALERIFERHVSDDTQPSVVMLTLGPGRSTQPAEVAEVLRSLQASGWIRTVTLGEAASLRGKDSVEVAPARLASQAPADYWGEVAEGRRWAKALSSAAGERDRDAEAAWYAALLSESGMWAGADGSWSLADRGHAFASAARRVGTEVLGGIDLETQDVTLSGKDGEMPVSLSNRSERPLSVTVRLQSADLAFPGGGERTVQLLPVENYLTFPVDLRSALSGTVQVTVTAGDIVLKRAQVDVQASYIDRIALVAAVVLVLVGMLFYIKRRVDRADAGIIGNGRG